MQLKLVGQASDKQYNLPIESDHLELTILEFLRTHGIPMASSCDGRQQCKKCIFYSLTTKKEQLGCSSTIKSLLSEQNLVNIEISYL